MHGRVPRGSAQRRTDPILTRSRGFGPWPWRPGSLIASSAGRQAAGPVQAESAGLMQSGRASGIQVVSRCPQRRPASFNAGCPVATLAPGGPLSRNMAHTRLRRRQLPASRFGMQPEWLSAQGAGMAGDSWGLQRDPDGISVANAAPKR